MGSFFKQVVRKIWKLILPFLRVLRGKYRRFVLVPSRRVLGPKIPLALVTGTKGKTTTTRMLAHILTKAGHVVGFSTTDGVVVNGEYVNHSDASDYYGARTVLTHPSVTAAVLETARGGLLKFGLYKDRCNVAALLNVGKEQIGIEGIDTLEQMAALKQRVINAAREAVVLNADDALCVGMIGQYRKLRVFLFSMESKNQIVHEHLQNGGTAYVLNREREEERIERWDPQSREPFMSIPELPTAGNGMFPQNIANAMAAAALAEGMGIPLETIKEGLHSFRNSLEQSGGRLHFIEGYTQTILIDFLATVPGSMALAGSLERIEVPGRRICMCTTAGDRQHWHYTEIGEALGSHFDHFICFDVAHYRRGRAPGEISDLLKAAFVTAGVSPECIDTAQEYTDATKQLSRVVGKNDLVVILIPSTHKFMPVFREHFAMHKIT